MLYEVITRIHGQGAGGNFQQGIGAGIETSGLHVDDDRIVAAKTGLKGMDGGVVSHCPAVG